MRIGIAGSGRTGCSLAMALAAEGASVSGVFSRKPEDVLGVFIRTGIECESDIGRLVLKSDAIFLTVPDSAIENFAEEIAGLCGSCISGKVFFHCSGALTSGVLNALADRGAVTGSLHPIQTFPDREKSWKAMYGIYFGFEGSDGAKEAAACIAEKLKGKMLIISPETKPLYHAAACVISNYSAALSYLAGKLMERAGIPGDEGLKALAPLFRNTAENVAVFGSAKALTGPVSRGDISTVAGHLAAIGEDKGIAEVYRVLGRLTVELAIIKGTIDKEQAAGMLALLG